MKHSIEKWKWVLNHRDVQSQHVYDSRGHRMFTALSDNEAIAAVTRHNLAIEEIVKLCDKECAEGLSLLAERIKQVDEHAYESGYSNGYSAAGGNPDDLPG